MAPSSKLSPIIVALDVDSKAEAVECVKRFSNHVDVFKVGLQLFSREGFPAVQSIIDAGKKVFVDLKLHDIPNTVAGAVRRFMVPGVEFLTLHASGGETMIAAAAKEVSEAKDKNPAVTTRILSVTVLTSLDDEDLRMIGFNHSAVGQVLNLSRIARRAGSHGVVASPQEVSFLRKEHGNNLVIVTPGIRPSQSGNQDQKRVMTPADAIREGSDFLVMGRSLMDAPSPEKTLQEILNSLEGL
jgi:orotidine-5'-phosphate decarboxylase